MYTRTRTRFCDAQSGEQVQGLLELFMPGVPFAKLRLCVLLSFVSGDPVMPLEEATGVRQSIHLLVNSSDTMPVVHHVLSAAQKASRLPCEVTCAKIVPHLPTASNLPRGSHVMSKMRPRVVDHKVHTKDPSHMPATCCGGGIARGARTEIAPFGSRKLTQSARSCVSSGCGRWRIILGCSQSLCPTPTRRGGGWRRASCYRSLS